MTLLQRFTSFPGSSICQNNLSFIGWRIVQFELVEQLTELLSQLPSSSMLPVCNAGVCSLPLFCLILNGWQCGLIVEFRGSVPGSLFNFHFLVSVPDVLLVSPLCM